MQTFEVTQTVLCTQWTRFLTRRLFFSPTYRSIAVRILYDTRGLRQFRSYNIIIQYTYFYTIISLSRIRLLGGGGTRGSLKHKHSSRVISLISYSGYCYYTRGARTTAVCLSSSLRSSYQTRVLTRYRYLTLYVVH